MKKLIAFAIIIAGICNAESIDIFPQFQFARTNGDSLSKDSSINFSNRTGTEQRAVLFFAQGPDSATYTDSIFIYPSFDRGITYSTTPVILYISNASPDASQILLTQATVYAVRSKHTGTIPAGGPNGRKGIKVGILR